MKKIKEMIKNLDKNELLEIKEFVKYEIGGRKDYTLEEQYQLVVEKNEIGGDLHSGGKLLNEYIDSRLANGCFFRYETIYYDVLYDNTDYDLEEVMKECVECGFVGVTVDW